MSNPLYAVTKEGVYRHEIMGVYNDFNLAVNRAIDCMNSERDNWHQFDVLYFYLNEDMEDGKLAATISRRDGKILVKLVY